MAVAFFLLTPVLTCVRRARAISLRWIAAALVALIPLALCACSSPPPGEEEEQLHVAPVASDDAPADRPGKRRARPTQADQFAVEALQAELESDLAQRRVASLLHRVSVPWIQARTQGAHAADVRVQELLAKLIGPGLRLIVPSKRLGARFWRGWWITTYGDAEASLALGWVRTGQSWQVATCELSYARDRCCDAPTVGEGTDDCACCQVEAHGCFCPRPGDPPPPSDAWEITCCLAQRTDGRAICRGCLELHSGGGLERSLARLEYRVQRRSEQARHELRLVSDALLRSGEVGLSGPPVAELTRAREALRAAQVRYAEHAEVMRAALNGPAESTRAGIRALPEPRLRLLEAEQRRRLKTTRAQLLVVRSELSELGVNLAPLDIAGVSSASLWLPAGVAAASRRAVGHASLSSDTPPWLRLAQLEPPPSVAVSQALRLGRRGRSLWDRAVASLSRDDTQGAIEFMRRIERYQALSHDQTRALAEALVTRAVGKAGIGDYEAAERDTSLAIRRDPRCAWAYSHRGYCRRRLGRLDEAAKDLLTARELGSDEASGQLAGLAERYAQRAWERNRLQDTDGAVEDWRRAWKIEKALRQD